MYEDIALWEDNITRRTFFQQCGYGLGGVALASLLAQNGYASDLAAQGQKGVLKAPHFAPRAKSVIFMFMAGAPTQLDLFDYKPELVKHHGENCPQEILDGERFAFIKGVPKLLGSPYKFKQAGKSGQWVSELLPHFSTIADDVTVIRTMTTDQFNHAPAQLFMNTGFQIPGRPSIGSWLTYGLGSVNKDLPGFVVLVSGEKNPDGGKSCWSSGFLPSNYQGVEFRSNGEPVLFVQNPEGVDPVLRRDMLDGLRDLNQLRYGETKDPELLARIEQYELAYRMQTSVPELVDLSQESDATLSAYGIDAKSSGFGKNCLLARRMVEKGVRFVQLYHRGWDNHGTGEYDDIKTRLPKLCREVDQAAAALVLDLKQRGLLDETLVIWGGEFGRTPMNEGRNGSTYMGRDHHPRAFSIWMAGGGVKSGFSHGSTDELGYNIGENPVHVHDLNATILHLMGIDHTRLTYRHVGRDFRLTDVAGSVVHEIIR